MMNTRWHSFAFRVQALGLLVVLFASIVVGQPGKAVIKGTITDKSTGEPLIGVNVSVKGTYKGAVTDVEGKFVINDVGPGSYTVQISYIGYKQAEYASLNVTANQVVNLDTKLEQTALNLGQEVVVYGDKPLFNIEETQSTHTVSAKELKVAAVSSMQDIVALQPGVVQGDGEIHIRGGRTYENAYIVDGISVQDPLSGTGFGLQVSPDAIQDVEVITGGYNAEYGQATSGVVSVTTKDGGSSYNGTIMTKRDHFGFNDNSRSNSNTDLLNATLSGPEPVFSYLLPALGVTVPGTVSFFGTAYMNVTDEYTRWAQTVVDGAPEGYHVAVPSKVVSSLFPNAQWLSPRTDNNWSWFGKFTWKPSPTIKLSFVNSTSITINQDTKAVQTTLEHVDPVPGYQYTFQNIFDSANTFTQLNVENAIQFTQTLDPRTFYEIHLSRFSAHVRADANGKYYTQYNDPRDIITLPLQYYHKGSDTIGVIPGDGFYDIGNAGVWRDQSTIEYTAKLDVTHDFAENHRFKTGIESRFQDLQMIDLLDPWYKPLGLDNDIFDVHPAMGALYAQDNLKLKGMILDAGMRLDYWFPGSYVDDAVNLPSSETNIPSAVRAAYFNDTYGVFGHRMKARLSPRLGVSHPVSDNQSLFFSYGHFSKFPRPQFVYSKLIQSSALSTSQVIGDPDLNPETTVAYELGIRNQLSGNDVLTVTSYYKDIFDYISAKTLVSSGSRLSSLTYTTYVNLDYSRIRGIELEYKKRVGDWFSGALSGSYSVATGKSSTADDAIYNIQQGLTPTLTEQPASYDRPFQGTLNLDFTSKPDGSLIGNSEGFIRFFYESGKRYTPVIYYGNDPQTGRPEYISDYNHPYSAIAAPWFYIDVTIQKNVNIGLGKLQFTLELLNLLNNQNSQIINPVTGRAYQYGDPTVYPSSPLVNDPKYPQLTAPVSPYPYDPSRYLNPFTARFGASIAF
ncbi:MAG TPA: TonB-dependent receptor [Bacteroidota bacterium]|nr:TonB-dependent receptor [Bacteroidota bacterium]